MALHELHFEFKVDHPVELRKAWTHAGVVGSGDMEVLMERKDLEGSIKVKVVTPVKGFERIWGLILERFIRKNQLGNVLIEINDNFATPVVASMRLSQALADAKEPGPEG